MRTFVITALLVLVPSGIYFGTDWFRGEEPPKFRTSEVERGDLLLTISATGTLEPQEIVDVGAQVVGRIKEFGIDPSGKRIDYGSNVEEGTVLARIDEALYLATRNQAQASLDRAEADLIQFEARLAQTEAEWERAQRLRNVKLTSLAGLTAERGSGPPAPTTVKGISDADFILAKANFEVAKSNVDVGKAAVEQQRATLKSAETNLDYTVIKSPVKGTIIDRRVNVGQTVVASLNAPSLFLIARDLRLLEVWTAVNEADIGRLKVGMPVHFTVDAFPDDLFQGEVSQIRLNAQMTQHVVTYTVVVTTKNDDLKLMPYLSANVRFEVDHREDALLVPNAALRYRPRTELIVAAPAAAERSPGEDSEQPPADAASQDDDDQMRQVWVKQGNKVYPVEVRIGLTDGAMTEIVGGEVTEGMEIVLSEEVADQAAPEATNPFAPPRFRGKKKESKSS